MKIILQNTYEYETTYVTFTSSDINNTGNYVLSIAFSDEKNKEYTIPVSDIDNIQNH